MKATLEFNLPEEAGEFDVAATAQRTQRGIWDFREWLRYNYKHQELTEAQATMLDEIKAMFWDCLPETDD